MARSAAPRKRKIGELGSGEKRIRRALLRQQVDNKTKHGALGCAKRKSVHCDCYVCCIPAGGFPKRPDTQKCMCHKVFNTHCSSMRSESLMSSFTMQGPGRRDGRKKQQHAPCIMTTESADEHTRRARVYQMHETLQDANPTPLGAAELRHKAVEVWFRQLARSAAPRNERNGELGSATKKKYMASSAPPTTERIPENGALSCASQKTESKRKTFQC